MILDDRVQMRWDAVGNVTYPVRQHLNALDSRPDTLEAGSASDDLMEILVIQIEVPT